MLDWVAITLTLTAMAIDLIVLFFLSAVIKRTKGRFRWTLIFFFIAIFILFVRRILNVLNLVSIYNIEVLDDAFAVVVATMFLTGVIYLFRDIRALTDVRLNHSRETRRENNFPPPRRQPGEEFERQRERAEEKNIRMDGDGKRRLRVVNGYVDFTND